MTRPRFTFRPNLQNEEHRRAWETLQGVSEGRRNAFLVRAILQIDSVQQMEEAFRRVLREERSNLQNPPHPSAEESLPPAMLGFLNSLDEDA